jgi:BON domain-containing protein
MLKQILSVAVMAVMILTVAAPAAAANSELSGDQMFEITKALYFQLGEISNRAAGDNITSSVVADGTVILQGRASSDATATKAKEAAESITDVKRVVNNIQTPGPAPAD